MSPTRVCPSTARITPGGEPPRDADPVVRCEHHEGHAGVHFVALAWLDDDAIDWPEAHDPDESFDVEVDLEPRVAARLDLQERYGDGPSASDRFALALDEAVPVAPLDLRLEEHAASINAAAQRMRAALEAKVDRE